MNEDDHCSHIDHHHVIGRGRDTDGRFLIIECTLCGTYWDQPLAIYVCEACGTTIERQDAGTHITADCPACADIACNSPLSGFWKVETDTTSTNSCSIKDSVQRRETVSKHKS